MNEFADLVGVYLNDINTALKDISDEDILDIFKRLYEREQAFAKKLQSTAPGRKVYLAFIEKISRSQGGIKIAKSYFRARQASYLNTVNKAIRDVQPKLMYPVPINYRFCLFAIDTLNAKEEDKKKQPFIDALDKMFTEIKVLREEIINKHLYLALHKAGVYKKSLAGKSTDFEDLIQLANEALVVAVDKYCIDDDSSTFHAMAIGRIISNLITHGAVTSAATVGQHAGKKLYQIRKMIQRYPNMNSKDMAKALQIAEDEINDLMAATAYKSLDDKVSDDSDTRLIDTFVAPTDTQDGFDAVEDQDTRDVLHESFSVLSLLEKKVLQLKGIKIHEDSE